MGNDADIGAGNIDCRRCVHFHITWDSTHPKGCRAMGFKSFQWPWMEVLQTSGEPCMMFLPKPKHKPTWQTKTETGNGAEPSALPGSFSRVI